MAGRSPALVEITCALTTSLRTGRCSPSARRATTGRSGTSVAMMKRALPREPKAPPAAEHRSGSRCSASVRMRGRGMQDDASDRGLGPLHHAAEVVAQRWQQYGPPAAHFRQVARRWSLTIGTTVRPEQVVFCLLDLKIVRLAHDPGHWDSLV